MNWHRHVWYDGRFDINTKIYQNTFSNLSQSFTEALFSGPYGVALENMAEANQVSLRIYRTACRHIPSLLNRSTLNYQKDYHMSKRNLAQWFRRGRDMKNLSEITTLHRTTQDYLYDSIYNNIENTQYMRFLQLPPQANERMESYMKFQGINFAHEKKFANKTRFFEKFVKGVRVLPK